ncbi:MAG: LysM peptidoglycan-binding domain-containing protein [Methylococcaceae bacterium]
MRVNFNRSAKLLWVSLIVTGCSQTPTSNLDLHQQPPVLGQDDGPYFYQNRNNLNKSKLRFTKSDNKKNQPINTVWERLFSLYALPEVDNERVDRELNWYLQHPDYIARIQQRAEPYLHLILNEIEANNLPGELALLPVVESAFRPEAYSKSDASGLWQFIPATGRLFGLEQNSWYDGRRDIYASTKAATTFLRQLNETFDGDWFLALASYNYGKGNIRKAIEKNQDLSLPTDYWSLSLPEETTNYVPRLLAVAKLFANAEKYNITLQQIPNEPFFEVIDIKSQLDLDKAALMANTPLDDFLKLNPGFNRMCTAPEGPHRLLIPVDQVQAFKKNLAELPYEDRVAQRRYAEEKTAKNAKHEDTSTHSEQNLFAYTKPYKVKRGETLSAIAKANQTSIDSLCKLNHLKIATVKSGTFIKLPTAAPIKTSNERTLQIKQLAKSAAIKSKPESKQVYVVKKGDTFFKIAQNYSVSTQDIANWNKIPLKSALVPGQKISIKSTESPQSSSTSVAATATRLIRYTVKPGDSLMQISRKFNVSLADLHKWNSSAIDKLHPGQSIKILIENNQPTT